MGGIAPARAAVALGSNLGDRSAHLDFARRRLAVLLQNCRFSSIFETAPVDVPGPSSPFLNAAAVGDVTCSPRELLEGLLAIERERGRERPFTNAPRTLDLDLILFGDLVVAEPGLRVPHPRFRERRFVLEPLAEVAPDMIDPVTGRTVREILVGRKK